MNSIPWTRRARVFAPANAAIGLGALACGTGVLHLAVGIGTHNLARAPFLATSGVEYYAAVIGLLAGYAAVVIQVDASPSRRAWCVLIGVPLAIQIGWPFPCRFSPSMPTVI
jgi:hypothetical protein